jgi:CBS domain containing-hemolysin-like protein
MTLVDAGQKEGAIETEEKEMILSVLQFGETMAYEVMVPRPDVVALEISTSFHDALRRFIESGHSRIPVYRDTIDNIEGLLYAKDLLTVFHQNGENGTSRPQSIRELMRPAYFVPETKLAGLLLKELQTSKIHMAIVVDEYGGTAGLLTIENLIEEIVGDIQDEYDINEEAEYTVDGPDVYTIDASMNLDDVNELLDVALPTEDSSTLGGFIYSRVGRVPTIGEIVEDSDNHLVLRVESVDGRRIRKVRVERQHQPADDELSQAPADSPTTEADPRHLDKAG